jgi:nucleoid-associated protein YgaU
VWTVEEETKMSPVVKKFGMLALVVVAVAALATGCSKEPPPQIEQVNRALKDATDACATVYAKDELAKVEPLVDAMNELAADGKNRKAGKEADALIPAVDNVRTVADQRRELALGELDKDMQAAEDTMKQADSARKEAETLTAGARSSAANLATAIRDAEAARGELQTAMDGAPASATGDMKEAEAGMAELLAAIKVARAAQAEVDYSAAKHDAAAAKLREAQELAGDPCMYREAEAAAEEAQKLGEEARLAAIQAARLASDQQAAVAKLIAELERETAEALVLAKMLSEMVRAYTVVRGDYLWRISGMNDIYAAPKFWPLIFDANRDQIQDPDLIYPGQNLSIPRQMEEVEMMDALHVMWGKAARGEDL